MKERIYHVTDADDEVILTVKSSQFDDVSICHEITIPSITAKAMIANNLDSEAFEPEAIKQRTSYSLPDGIDCIVDVNDAFIQVFDKFANMWWLAYDGRISFNANMLFQLPFTIRDNQAGDR